MSVEGEVMIKPEHKEHCEYLIRAIFQHELNQKKVYQERDLIREYFQIRQKVEAEFDGLDVQQLIARGMF